MIITLGFLVGALLIFFDLLQPAYGDLQQKRGEQVSKEALLTSEQQVVTQAKTLLTKYESETQAQTSLALAMPSGQNVANAIAQIYGIAQGNSIIVKSIGVSVAAVQQQISTARDSNVSLSASQIVKPMGKISLQFSGNGSYENLKTFLSQLETNIRLFDLTGFSLAPQANIGSGPVSQDAYTYGITADTYYQLP